MLTIIAGTVGFLTVFTAKVLYGFAHFASPHAFWGLWTFLFTYFVFIGGIVTRYSWWFRRFIRPAVIKLIHSFCGMVVVLMGILTVILSICSQWWDHDIKSEVLKWVFVGVLVVSAICLIMDHLPSMKNRFASVFRRVQVVVEKTE